MKNKIAGMHHVALNFLKLEKCIQFYTKILSMKVEWNPDKNSFYLTSGNDNLALHRNKKIFLENKNQHLAHIGFILDIPEAVDEWYQKLLENNVFIKAKPRTHRDGARSFYCLDPDSNFMQLISHSPLSNGGK